LGVDTILVEGNRVGGTCLNVGCIPSKALIHTAQAFHRAVQQAGGQGHGVYVSEPRLDWAEASAWRNGVVTQLCSGVTGLLERSGVKTLSGWATFRDGKTVDVKGETGTCVIRAENVVIATGSRPVELFDLQVGGNVLDSTAALALDAVPERLGVIGAGYIGLELGTAFAKLGSHVTIIEAGQTILPQYDDKLTRHVQRRLEALGIALKLDTRVTDWGDGAGVLTLDTKDGVQTLDCDKVLVTVGRIPQTDDLGLEELQLRQSGGVIEIDDRCQTSMRGVYAIGDVTP
jgi:dihydrolipoamide dehydrogenase